MIIVCSHRPWRDWRGNFVAAKLIHEIEEAHLRKGWEEEVGEKLLLPSLKCWISVTLNPGHQIRRTDY